jgi:hypothetical protein
LEAEAKWQILVASGVHATNCFEKYLGLLAMVGQSRRLAFTYIKEKICSRICNWKNKFLSQARKEILLKAVYQLIPTYTISIFMLPKVLREINGMMQKLRWSRYDQDSKIHWIW